MPKQEQKDDIEMLLLLSSPKEKRLGKKDSEYELARASIEGLFPPQFWMQMNQSWAGLGQMLNKSNYQKLILEYVDRESKKWDGKWRQCNQQKMFDTVKQYIQ